MGKELDGCVRFVGNEFMINAMISDLGGREDGGIPRQAMFAPRLALKSVVKLVQIGY